MAEDSITLEAFLHEHGFTAREMQACATIIYLSGAWDGLVKGDEPLPNKYLELLVDKGDFHSRLQVNLFKKFRGERERQQIATEVLLSPIRERLLDAFTELGFLAPPSLSTEGVACDYALVFGASQAAMSRRIDTVLEQVSVREQLVLLVGARPLWVDAEPCCIELLTRHLKENMAVDAPKTSLSQEGMQAEADRLWASCPEGFTVNQKRASVKQGLQTKYRQDWWPTERDAAEYLVEKKRQEGRRLSEVSVVEAPCRQDGSRPDTIDTVVAFSEQYQDKLVQVPDVVAVSSYPYIREQALSLKLLPDGVRCRVIGDNAAEASPALVETLLAGFAGYFYKYRQVELLKKNPKPGLQSQCSY